MLNATFVHFPDLIILSVVGWYAKECFHLLSFVWLYLLHRVERLHLSIELGVEDWITSQYQFNSRLEGELIETEVAKER